MIALLNDLIPALPDAVVIWLVGWLTGGGIPVWPSTSLQGPGEEGESRPKACGDRVGQDEARDR